MGLVVWPGFGLGLECVLRASIFKPPLVNKVVSTRYDPDLTVRGDGGLRLMFPLYMIGPKNGVSTLYQSTFWLAVRSNAVNTP